MSGEDKKHRSHLPIPTADRTGLITYDARDPDTKFPAIEQLRPPKGAPNVVLILIDDAGFGASSAFGGPCQTPNAEKLATGGLKYNRFHTTALCSPTRQALLTGRNHHSAGMGGITEIATGAPGYSSVLPNTISPLARTLKLNGYSTAQFGKCHEVPVWETSPVGPFDAWPTGGGGFEYFYGFIGGEANHSPPTTAAMSARTAAPPSPRTTARVTTLSAEESKGCSSPSPMRPRTPITSSRQRMPSASPWHGSKCAQHAGCKYFIASTTRQEIIVIAETTAKPSLHQRAMHELKELVFISLYLYITIGAVILMKTAVLHTQGIEFTPWGIAIVKAVLLAKFMLLGEAMRIGGRSTTGPLIWPTLQKQFGLLVLLIIMTIIEEAVVGLFHHQSIAASLGDLFGPRLEETLAGYLIMLMVLLPYCAFRVLEEALGEGRLARMFFVEREPIERI